MKEKLYVAANVRWDCDKKTAQYLPTEVVFREKDLLRDGRIEEHDTEDDVFELISDLISDKIGYCHYGFTPEVREEEVGFTFRMYSAIRFNRPISLKKDYLFPGGYEMVMNGKTVPFDFDEYEGWVDETDRSVLHCVQRNPDYDTFPGLENVSEDDLSHVEKIEEFYVYTGEPGESDIEPVEILELGFEVIPQVGDIYDVSCDAVVPYSFPGAEASLRITDLERQLFIAVVQESIRKKADPRLNPKDTAEKLYNKYCSAAARYGTWMMSQEAAYAVANLLDGTNGKPCRCAALLALGDEAYLNKISDAAKSSVMAVFGIDYEIE